MLKNNERLEVKMKKVTEQIVKTKKTIERGPQKKEKSRNDDVI